MNLSYPAPFRIPPNPLSYLTPRYGGLLFCASSRARSKESALLCDLCVLRELCVKYFYLHCDGS
jgi:hypothetical protein